MNPVVLSRRRAGPPRLGDAGATRRDRMALSRRTGISTRLLFKWVNVSDLFRVRGVGGQYAELLVAAGVGTVEALCGCEAEQLAAAMSAVNSKRQRVRTLPNIRRISGWIEHARQLPVVEALTYEKPAIRVLVKDVRAAQKILLDSLASEDLLVRKFEILHPSLEDIFLRLTGTGA